MPDHADPLLSRRQMLARLGLAAGAGYAAPTLIGLGESHAQGNNSRPSRPSRSSRPSRVRRPGGSRASRPSQPSR